MATTTTPNLNLTLAVPGTNEAFSTATVNQNFTVIDADAGATDSALASLDSRLDAIEPTTTAGGAMNGLAPAGTAAQRDAYWGTPSNATERVALANKAPRWLNTQNGYLEQYFCNDDDNATGGYKAIFATASPGWWPVGGRTPYCLVEKNIAQSTSAGTITVTWSTVAAQERTHSSMYSTAQNTRLTAPVRGLYRIRAKARTSGVLPMTLNLYRDGVKYDRADVADVGATGAATTVLMDSLVFVDANSYVDLRITSTGVQTLNTDGTMWFEMVYERPEYTGA